MTPYWEDDTVTLYLGDCLDIMRTLPDASVDAVVCDPPYALTELATARVLEAIAAWMRGEHNFVPDGPGGFMGRRWDRFVPPPGAWDECMRVLKPGGHLLCFSAPRTADLMGMSIRIAGFEIRDSIHWIGGQGFPKGTDVGKAIDKAAGVERKVVGTVDYPGREGWTNAAHDRKAQVWGEFDAQHLAKQVTAPATAEAARWEGWNTSLKPAHEPVIVARRPLSGTVAQTVLEHGTGALNINACRTGSPEDKRAAGTKTYAPHYLAGETNGRGVLQPAPHDGLGRWPTNVVLSHPPLVVDGEVVGDACADGCVEGGCPVAELDRQSGDRPSGGRTWAEGDRDTEAWRRTEGRTDIATRSAYERGRDSGGASRFFPTFRYEAKAPAHERPKLPDGTAHATVKPLALMRFLVRLVTPPGGLVLDPFAGSGTTGEAAVIEGMRAVLIEREAPYAELIKARLSKPIAPALDLGDLT